MKKSLLFIVMALCFVACAKEQKPEPQELMNAFVANTDSVCAGQVLGDESNATSITAVSYADSTLLFACTLSPDAEIELELLEATAEDNLMPDVENQVAQILSDSLMAADHPEVLQLLTDEHAQVIFRVSDAQGQSFDLLAKQY
jgi:hypothetical protein